MSLVLAFKAIINFVLDLIELHLFPIRRCVFKLLEMKNMNNLLTCTVLLFLILSSGQVSANANTCPSIAADLSLLQGRKNLLTSESGRDNYAAILDRYNRQAALYSLHRGIQQIRMNYSEMIAFATAESFFYFETEFFSEYGPSSLNAAGEYLTIEGGLRRLLSSAGGVTLESLLPNCVDPESCQSPIRPICPNEPRACPAEEKAPPLYHALVRSCAQEGQGTDPLCQFLGQAQSTDDRGRDQRQLIINLLEKFGRTFITAQSLETTTQLTLEQKIEMRSTLNHLYGELVEGLVWLD